MSSNISNRSVAPGQPAVTAVVNGEPRSLASGTTVAEVVAELASSARGVAVALNGDVVPKSSWQLTSVGDGDQLEILTAAQGG